MKDYQASLKAPPGRGRLRRDPGPRNRREMFDLLVQHLRRLADEVEKAVARASRQENSNRRRRPFIVV